MARIVRLSGAMAAALALLAAGCIGGVRGSGRVASEERSVAPFEAITVSGAIRAKITVGGQQRLKLTADDNILEIITTNVRDGRLTVGTTKGYSGRAQQPEVEITVPKLTGATASGASQISVTGVSGGDLTVKVSGASRFEGQGRVGKLTGDASGASRIEAGGLNAESAEIECSGASSAEVSASRTMKLKASGASTISYSGGGSIERVDSSGASTIRQK